MTRQKRTHARERTHYTEEQKIACATACIAMGGLTIEGIAQARQITNTNISKASLARWIREYRDTIIASEPSLAPAAIDTVALITTTRQAVIRNIAESLVKVTERAKQDDVINAASLRDLKVAQGIDVEKLLLLLGRTPEVEAAVDELQRACDNNPIETAQAIKDMTLAIRNHKALETPSLPVEISAHAADD